MRASGLAAAKSCVQFMRRVRLPLSCWRRFYTQAEYSDKVNIAPRNTARQPHKEIEDDLSRGRRHFAGHVHNGDKVEVKYNSTARLYDREIWVNVHDVAR